MQFREAEVDDAEVIREIAEASLKASYSLSPQNIQSAIEQWYSDGAIEEKIAADDEFILVAEEDSDVVGFSDSVLFDDIGEVEWLHVAPGHRGRGIGDDLYERTRQALRDRGADVLRGRVLRDNAEGNEFYERHDLAKIDETEVEIGGRVHVENVYVDDPGEGAELRSVDGPADRTLYVDEADTDRGSYAPFMVVYSDPSRENRYGYFCANCESLANSMDAMGRIECENCGNQRKATRWDASYM